MKRIDLSSMTLNDIKALGADNFADIDAGDLLYYLKNLCEAVGSDKAAYEDRDAGMNSFHNNYKIAATYIQMAIDVLDT